MASFSTQLDGAISTHDLLPAGCGCVVAVSGGRDSSLLLHALSAWNRGRGAVAEPVRFVVAHFHHQLRGADADADRDLVVAQARALGWTCAVDTADVRAASRDDESVETAGRRLRHAFLAKTARETGADRIATGHHAGDQTELFLMRLLRGAGGRGLGGMGWTDPSPAGPALHLIRPLLGFSSAQLACAARDAGLRWREDASNADTRHFRNRVRHALIPLLTADFQPALARVLARESVILRDQAEAIEAMARHWLPAAGPEPFDALPTAVRREAILVQLGQLGIPATFDLVELLHLHPEIPAQVDSTRRILRRHSGILERLPPAAEDLDFQLDEAEIAVGNGRDGNGLAFGGCEFTWFHQAHAADTPPSPVDGWSGECLDADAVGSMVRLRHWRPGDRFEPIGLGQPARLQDLFTNARIPPADRRRRVLAEAGPGRIVWVEGLRLGEIAKRTPRTTNLLHWRWRRRSEVRPGPDSG